jgi:ferredoxin-NADP reductase/DMSO/TMAO reductase YedYZ heme-binding membrane subunit
MKDLRFAKLVVLLNALVPGALLAWDAWRGQASANPVNYAILTTGMLALIFLCLTLAVTPLRKVTGFQSLFHFRRTLGLYAFFYAAAHFATFFVFDRELSVPGTLSEMVKRPYLIVGSIGLLAMVPLAATSTNSMIKHMGPKRWQALHRLAYVAAVAGAVHFYMQVKSDVRLPIAFGTVLGGLLIYRGTSFTIRQRKKSLPGMAPWTGLLKVDRIVRETWQVKTFRLVTPGGGAFPFHHLPGQYLNFTLEIGGRKVRRSYTIASTPSRPGYCEVTIKREEMGLVSRHMHDEVKEGDLLQVTASSGRFTFTGNEANRIVLVAAGVGITPLMSILRYLTDQNWNGRIDMLYSCKTSKDIIFREELEDLRQRFANFHLTITLSRPENDSWNGSVGRIDAGLLQRTIPDLASVPFYVCGPSEMLSDSASLLRQLGVAESNFHKESFGSRVSPTADDVGAEEHTVSFSRSKKSARISGNRPILALAEELDIEVDTECRSGICGRCKCRMTSGSVEMETQDALDAGDRRKKIILLCQARALEDVTVEI